MNGRVYDPVLARFLSPDPYVQAPDYTQNFNRYSYCLNNPFKYTDPSGELQIGPFYLSLNLGYSSGGFSFGISAGVGVENIASAGIYIGYNTSGSFTFSANAGVAGFYANGGYDTKGGWFVGAGWSIPIPSLGIVSFNSNISSYGITYSQTGGLSANIGAMQYSRDGISVSLSVGMSANLELGQKKGDNTTASTEKQRNEERKKPIYDKETSEQDNNYNFFYKIKDKWLRFGAEYVNDGGAEGNTIVINAHGANDHISTPTASGYMTAQQLHEYLLANNKLYRESFFKGKTITVKLIACNTGNGFAQEFSKFNPHMTVVAPSNYITNIALIWNRVDSPGQYLIFYNGK